MKSDEQNFFKLADYSYTTFCSLGNDIHSFLFIFRYLLNINLENVFFFDKFVCTNNFFIFLLLFMDPVLIARYGNVLHKDWYLEQFQRFHLQFVFSEFERKRWEWEWRFYWIQMELVKLANFFYFYGFFGTVCWLGVVAGWGWWRGVFVCFGLKLDGLEIIFNWGSGNFGGFWAPPR